MSDRIDWSELTYEYEGTTMAAPCMAFTLYLEHLNTALVKDFYDRAVGVLKPLLTHYWGESMKQPGPVTPRALTMVPTWLKRLDHYKFYSVWYAGGKDEGMDPAMLDVNLTWMPPRPKTAEEWAKAHHHWHVMYEQDLFREGLPASVIRVTLPVDHELADPVRFAEWVLGLDIVKHGEFVSGTCDYSLNYFWNAGTGDVKWGIKSPCSRYPGLDWFYDTFFKWVQRYEPSIQDILPLVKRAGWITLVNERSVEFLGGKEKLHRAFAAHPEIQVHELDHGVAIRAGSAPQLGNAAQGDFVPLYSVVGAVLRPVRVEHFEGTMGVGDKEWVREWLAKFDGEKG